MNGALPSPTESGERVHSELGVSLPKTAAGISSEHTTSCDSSRLSTANNSERSCESLMSRIEGDECRLRCYGKKAPQSDEKVALDRDKLSRC